MLIHENSRFRTSWDVFVIMLSLWICFTLPVDIAFEPEGLKNWGFTIFNYLTDAIFLIDIMFNFRTTIQDFITGDEVTDSKQIAMSYIKGRFFLDLLAAIPFELISNLLESGSKLDKFGLFSLVKIIRVLRFTKVISFLNTTESVKLSLRLFKLIFYLIIYLHWQACAWFFYTKQDKMWFPLPDLIQDIDTFYEHGVVFTYCFSVWHSVSILDGADMVPANPHQAIVVSFLVIVSEFIHAHIIGTMDVVLHSLSSRSS